MQNRRWMAVVSLALICAVAFTSGCRKTKRRGAGGVDDVGFSGSDPSLDIFSQGLAGRPEEGALETAGEFAPVYFDYDSSQVAPSERAKIEAVAERLKSGSAGGVIVEGHCDERGSTEYNLALGERRALAVRAYLVGLGVDPARIQTKSYGEERPVNMGHDESAWSQNRRGEFVLYQ